MNCRIPCQTRSARRARAGFTLAEVLAALLFMAIVIPVAVAGLRLATLAGVVGSRKAAACRVAERVLNETIVTRQWDRSSQSGTVREAAIDYRWTLEIQPSGLDTLREATVKVTFTAQGNEYDVSISTLLDTAS